MPNTIIRARMKFCFLLHHAHLPCWGPGTTHCEWRAHNGGSPRVIERKMNPLMNGWKLSARFRVKAHLCDPSERSSTSACATLRTSTALAYTKSNQWNMYGFLHLGYLNCVLFCSYAEYLDGIAKVFPYAYHRDRRQLCTVFLRHIRKTESQKYTVVSLALSDEPAITGPAPQCDMLPQWRRDWAIAYPTGLGWEASVWNYWYNDVRTFKIVSLPLDRGVAGALQCIDATSLLHER